MEEDALEQAMQASLREDVHAGPHFLPGKGYQLAEVRAQDGDENQRQFCDRLASMYTLKKKLDARADSRRSRSTHLHAALSVSKRAPQSLHAVLIASVFVACHSRTDEGHLQDCCRALS